MRRAVLLLTVALASTLLACVREPQSGGQGNGGTTGGAGAAGTAAGTGATGGAGSGEGGAAGTGATGGAGNGEGGGARINRQWGLDWYRLGLWQECSSSGTCADGMTCFRLSQELALCDGPPLPPDDACNQPMGALAKQECHCNGLSCQGGLICTAAQEYIASGPLVLNGCVESPCATPTDCADGMVCTPASLIIPKWASTLQRAGLRCTRPACQSDLDCVDGEHGRCSLLTKAPTQSGQRALIDIRCAYARPVDDASLCKGTRVIDLTGAPDGDYVTGYACAELAH
jgi:hypothetical protein